MIYLLVSVKTKVDNSDVNKPKTVPAQVYRARKYKPAITIHMDLRIKPSITQVSTVPVWISTGWKCFKSLEELEKVSL